MKFLLLGKGKTIEAIKKYLKFKKQEYMQAVFEFEYSKKYMLINDDLLKYDGIDYVIKSPGISETNQMYLKLKNKYKFISELDLLYLFDEKVKAIVLTGSNGKTTFASMLHYLLNKAKIKNIVCGNSFKPITHYFRKFKMIKYLIVEQSSFQLHNLSFFKPFISLILNLQDNHLDNSYSLNSYFENKMNIYKYQNKQNYFIYDDKVIKNTALNTNANIIDLLKYPFIDQINDNLKKYNTNIDYFYTIFKLLNIDVKYIIKLNDFKTLKYRQEIHKYKCTTYINDSKSTSVDATLFALKYIDELNNCILIIGGKDKKSSLEKLNNVNVAYKICYGDIINKAKKQIDNCIICNNLYEAFNIATSIYIKDKIVLFSPATSSLDQFKSFEERGKLFNNLMIKYEKNR